MIFLLLTLGACADDPKDSATPPTTTEGLPAELGDCAEGTDLGWADLEPVFAGHCTGCHSTTLTGDDRVGAPEMIDYDTEDAALANAFLTWSVIYSGQMPKTGSLSDENALTIWEWLSCGG